MARRDGGQTYGFPIYCAAWLPLAHILKPSSAEDSANADAPASSPPPRPMVALGGGGGEGRSGVPNALVVVALDSATEGAPALSPDPVFRLGTEEQVPYRMTVHPRGDGVICAFPNGCRRKKNTGMNKTASSGGHMTKHLNLISGMGPVDRSDYNFALRVKLYRLLQWESPEGEMPQELALRSDQDALVELKDVGLQLALVELKDVGLQLAVSFSGEGSILATGSEDGHLRVFKWPAMETVIEEPDTKTSVKDLSFSSDEKFLAVNRSSGPCKVWDLKSSEAVANLPREAGEIFGFCRFSNKPDNSQILFVTAMQGDYGKIISWNTTSWTRIGSKKVTREAISAFAVSADGTLLAIGTIEGSISVLASKDMRALVTVKKAHLGIVTTLAFSQDSRTLLSTSFDSTARVTSIGSTKSNGISMWPMILVIILAILVYYCMQHKEDPLAMLPK